ncbi:arginine deiminase-related protein [Kineococcus sp. R86509]|uniref:arginine deiminase-related protein n=1 Tax=Kineococcus sp. R86509 TaxID=3093851 RepID=UPI0036D39A00
MTATLDTPTSTGTAQAPAAVVLVRPHHFRPNPETVADNSFQRPARGGDTAGPAHAEVTALTATLEAHGVRVHLVEDTGHTTPDSVFCNNWFSTHPDGTVVVYPMHAENRRGERRADVLELLARDYVVTRTLDLGAGVTPGTALEGTGAMVLDHRSRTAFVCRSRRTDPALLQRFCRELEFEPVVVDAEDDGVPVYHTNVLMSVGTDVALVGTGLLTDAGQRRQLVAALEGSGREVVDLPREAIRNFAGNCLELQGSQRLLALSERAERALPDRVRAVVENHVRLLPVPVPTLELAGGSVRCTLGGIHLTPRSGSDHQR